MTNVAEMLRQAVAGVTEGRSQEAHDLLMRVVQEAEDDERAWLWMARVASTDRERQICLEKVLELNLEGQSAQEGLGSRRHGKREQASSRREAECKVLQQPIGDWATFLNSRPIGLQTELDKPTKDNAGGFEKRGIFSRGHRFRREGQSGVTLSPEAYRELMKKQKNTPVGVMSHQGSTWWLFTGDVYRESRQYTPSAVKVLVENALTRVESVETAQFRRSDALIAMLKKAPATLVTLLGKANSYLARVDSLCRLRDEIADRSDTLSRQASRLVELGRWIVETSAESSIDDETAKRQMRDVGFAPDDILEADLSASQLPAQENLLRWWFSRMRLVIVRLQALSSPLERVAKGLRSCPSDGLAIFEAILTEAEAWAPPDPSVQRDIFDAAIDSLGPGMARLQSFSQTNWTTPLQRRIEETQASLREVVPAVRAAMFAPPPDLEAREDRPCRGREHVLEPMDKRYPVAYASPYVLPRLEGEYVEADDGIFIRLGDRRIFQSSGRRGINLRLGEHRRLVEGGAPFRVMESGETTWWCCGRGQFYRERLGLTTATATELFHNRLDMESVASPRFREIISLIATVRGVDVDLAKALEDSSIQAGRLHTMCRRWNRLCEELSGVVQQTEALISLMRWIDAAETPGESVDQADIRNQMRELGFASEDVQDLVIETGAFPEVHVLLWVEPRLQVTTAKAARLVELLVSLDHVDIEGFRREVSRLSDRIDGASSDLDLSTRDACHTAKQLTATMAGSATEGISVGMQRFLWLSERMETFQESLETVAGSMRARLLARTMNRDDSMAGQVRQAVLDRDDYICRYCGRRSQTMEVDHIIPVSQGGGSTLDNLVTACRECNRRKAGRTPEEAGMEVLPVRTRKRSWE